MEQKILMLGTCKIASVVAFCSGVNSVFISSWIADDIRSLHKMDQMGCSLSHARVLLLFFKVIASYMDDAALLKVF